MSSNFRRASRIIAVLADHPDGLAAENLLAAVRGLRIKLLSQLVERCYKVQVLAIQCDQAEVGGLLTQLIRAHHAIALHPMIKIKARRMISISRQIMQPGMVPDRI